MAQWVQQVGAAATQLRAEPAAGPAGETQLPMGDASRKHRAITAEFLRLQLLAPYQDRCPPLHHPTLIQTTDHGVDGWVLVGSVGVS